MRGREREKSFKVLGVDGTLVFPISWMNDHIEITGYDKEYLNLEEVRIVHLLGKFEVMDTCTIVKLWLKGGNNLVINLGKFCGTLFYRLLLGDMPLIWTTTFDDDKRLMMTTSLE